MEEAELQLSPTELALVKKHLREKEGEETEQYLWQVQFKEGNELVVHTLLLTPLCLYVFQCEPMTEVVKEAPILQLESIEAVIGYEDTSLELVFDRKRTQPPISSSLHDPIVEPSASALSIKQEKAQNVVATKQLLLVGDDALMAEITTKLMEFHAHLSRISPAAFAVTLTIPNTPSWDNVVPDSLEEVDEFCVEFFLSAFRSLGMIEKRRMTADYLYDQQTNGERCIDLAVFQCMCSHFDAQVDFTALALFLMYDCHFERVFAEDVDLGDLALVCLLQAFQRNTHVEKLELSNTGLGPNGSNVLGKSLMVSGDRSRLQELVLCDDAVNLAALAPALPKLAHLRVVRLCAITHHVNEDIKQSGTAGFEAVLSNLPHTLTELDISRNFFTPRDAEALYTWLVQASRLTVLRASNVGGVQWSVVFDAMTHNAALLGSLRELDVSFGAVGVQSDALERLCLWVLRAKALRTLVLDGCGLSNQGLVQVFQAIVGNVSLVSMVLCLRSLAIGAHGWALLGKAMDQAAKRKVGVLKELYLDRNELGVDGLLAVLTSLGAYPHLRALSLDQNLVEGEVISQGDVLHDSSNVRALVDVLCSVLMGERALRLRSFSIRGDPSSPECVLGPAACRMLIGAVGRSPSLEFVDLCFNALGHRGYQAVSQLLAGGKSCVRHLTLTPDHALDFEGWQSLFGCVEKAGNSVVLAGVGGVDVLYQKSIKLAASKKEQELLGRLLAQLKVKVAALPGLPPIAFSARSIPPLRDVEQYADLEAVEYEPVAESMAYKAFVKAVPCRSVVGMRRDGDNGEVRAGRSRSLGNDDDDDDDDDLFHPHSAMGGKGSGAFPAVLGTRPNGVRIRMLPPDKEAAAAAAAAAPPRASPVLPAGKGVSRVVPRDGAGPSVGQLPAVIRRVDGQAFEFDVWGKQAQQEPRDFVPVVLPPVAPLTRAVSSFSGAGDSVRRRKSLLQMFESLTHHKNDPGMRDKEASLSSRSELQGDHMRLLLRICNKVGTPVSDEDREALGAVLFSLSPEQQADYQARARALLMPYVPSSKFRKKAALGGVPDVSLSRYAVGFHAGTELQPLNEVLYETITITSQSSAKVNFEVEQQPRSRWPDYKLTVYPDSGVLRKGKPEDIMISFIARQQTDAKELVVLNINGCHRLIVSVRASADVPVFGVDPFALDVVSMSGVVVPRILNQLRAYVVNHGGLRLPGIFHRVPDPMLCYAMRQQINRHHLVSAKVSNDTLYCVAHMIKTFFSELPQPLLNPLPLGSLAVDDPDAVRAAFGCLSSQSLSLFVWLLDLLVDVAHNAEHNQIPMRVLAEQMAPCLHSTEHHGKVQALLYAQLMEFSGVTPVTHRSVSINQLTNHASLRAKVGNLLPVYDKNGVEADESLPAGWKLFRTKTPRKRPFYHNAELNLTQWHRPGGENSELPPGWTMHRTKTPKQRVFYHNKELGKTQWQPPT